MPRTEEAYQRIRDAQREKILESARTVFAAKGWSATMSDVAGAAEVSQGLAYRYFASKEALIRELVVSAVEGGLGVLQGIREKPVSPMERLAFLLTWTFEARDNQVGFYQFILRGLNDEGTPPDLREILRKPGQAYQEMLRSLIVEGQASGEIAQGDPDQLVIAIIAFFDGLTRFPLRRTEYFRKHFPDRSIILRILKP